MFTYLVLPFGSAPLFSWKKCRFYVRLMRCGMVFSCYCVPFRTPTYIAVWVTVWVKTDFQKYGQTFWLQNARKSSEIKRFRSFLWQAAPIKISAVFLVFSMVSAFWGKVFGACCFILLVAAVQPKKILWDLWNFVRSARFCQRSPLWRLSCFVRFRS